MKALIVYASWFGHNRTIARALAAELTRQGLAVACKSARQVTPHDLAGLDLLVLGTYTHAAKASGRLRALCETIPRHQFDQMAVAVFGTQMQETRQQGMPGGVDDLQACLTERGCELALDMLRIELPQGEQYHRVSGLSAEQRQRVEGFAADLWEASVPAPLV